MKREVIGTSLINGEGVAAADSVVCRYYITEPEPGVFGIEVEKTQSGNVVETSRVYDVCRAADRAHEIAVTLMENTVTPMTLHDILYDITADG